MRNEQFRPQVELLLDILPLVGAEPCFALKGGTAINLFVRDLPRLSIDIDLAYTGLESREIALKLIEAALGRIQKRALDLNGVKVFSSRKQSLQSDMKLFVSRHGVQIKVEVSPVIRGTLVPPKEMALVAIARKQFEKEAIVPVVDLPDLYGGKIVAALDRQHPRDIFDIKLLLENEGITDSIRKGFIVYLLSHGRPIHEVLNPTRIDQSKVFESEFMGMTEIKFDYEDFESTREELIANLRNQMTQSEKALLFSVVNLNPDWSLLGIKGADELPAVQWKLLNLAKLSAGKRKEQMNLLTAIF